MNASGKSLVLGGLLLVATVGAAMAQVPCTSASFAFYTALGSTGCTVGDKTFSNFVILANSTVATAATITVTPIMTDVGNNTAVGVAFNGAFAGPTGGIADISFTFNVTENNPASAITAVQLSTNGAGSFCDSLNMGTSGVGPLNLFSGTIADFIQNGQHFDCSQSSVTTPTFSPVLQTLIASDDLFIQSGTVTTITKLFVQQTMNMDHGCTNCTANDSEEPGSVIVFPKFLRGLVTVDGVSLPATEIEVGVVCPHHLDGDGKIVNETCPENQPVKIRFSWVCGAFEFFNSQICRQNNFDVLTSVNGKVVFDPENLTITGSTGHAVPVPPCTMGYLIGYVVNPANDQPIKFDGLVGDVIIRESGTAVSAFNGIAIQAANTTAVNGLGTPIATAINPNTRSPALVFDGLDNHYAAVTHTIMGDVKFTNDPATAAFPIRSAGFLTLLTLDVLSDFPNNPVIVDINWWNEGERLLSTSTEFICWAEYPLTMIDPNLTASQMGSRKGVFRSTLANKVSAFGITDSVGPVTLLGVVEQLEGPTLTERTYFYPAFNNSDPVPTEFVTE